MLFCGVNCDNSVPKITGKMNKVTLEIFHRIINSAADGNLYVDFSVDMFILKYKQNEIPLPELRKEVLAHLKEMFPPVKFKHYGMNRLGYAIYRASWRPHDYIDYDYTTYYRIFGSEEHIEL